MIQRNRAVFGLLVALSLAMGGLGVKNGEAANTVKSPEKRAILLVAFGTSIAQARKAYDIVEASVKREFPGVAVRWAFTSGRIRAKLALRGKHYDSPELALARLMDERFTHVAVMSLHVVPGQEFTELEENALVFPKMVKGLKKVAVARPLLSSQEDIERVARGVLKNVPPWRKPGDVLLLMGHGNEKFPQYSQPYEAMGRVLAGLDPNARLALVEGSPSLEDLLPSIRQSGAKRAYLVPLMAVAGDHARNDMAGNEPGSWKSVLAREGITARALLTGIVEYPEVLDVWMDHLRAAWREIGG